MSGSQQLKDGNLGACACDGPCEVYSSEINKVLSLTNIIGRLKITQTEGWRLFVEMVPLYTSSQQRIHNQRDSRLSRL